MTDFATINAGHKAFERDKLTNEEMAELIAGDERHDAQIDALDRAHAILVAWDRDCREVHEQFMAECAASTAAFEEAMK